MIKLIFEFELTYGAGIFTQVVTLQHVLHKLFELQKTPWSSLLRRTLGENMILGQMHIPFDKGLSIFQMDKILTIKFNPSSYLTPSTM